MCRGLLRVKTIFLNKIFRITFPRVELDLQLAIRKENLSKGKVLAIWCRRIFIIFFFYKIY